MLSYAVSFIPTIHSLIQWKLPRNAFLFFTNYRIYIFIVPLVSSCICLANVLFMEMLLDQIVCHTVWNDQIWSSLPFFVLGQWLVYCTPYMTQCLSSETLHSMPSGFKIQPTPSRPSLRLSCCTLRLSNKGGWRSSLEVQRSCGFRTGTQEAEGP